jgi:hypothetical protein
MVNLTSFSRVCSTHRPVTTAPVSAYLPDGSRHNDLFNVSKEGKTNISYTTLFSDELGSFLKLSE